MLVASFTNIKGISPSPLIFIISCLKYITLRMRNQRAKQTLVIELNF